MTTTAKPTSNVTTDSNKPVFKNYELFPQLAIMLAIAAAFVLLIVTAALASCIQKKRNGLKQRPPAIVQSGTFASSEVQLPTAGIVPTSANTFEQAAKSWQQQERKQKQQITRPSSPFKSLMVPVSMPPVTVTPPQGPFASVAHRNMLPASNVSDSSSSGMFTPLQSVFTAATVHNPAPPPTSPSFHPSADSPVTVVPVYHNMNFAATASFSAPPVTTTVPVTDQLPSYNIQQVSHVNYAYAGSANSDPYSQTYCSTLPFSIGGNSRSSATSSTYENADWSTLPSGGQQTSYETLPTYTQSLQRHPSRGNNLQTGARRYPSDRPPTLPDRPPHLVHNMPVIYEDNWNDLLQNGTMNSSVPSDTTLYDVRRNYTNPRSDRSSARISDSSLFEEIQNECVYPADMAAQITCTSLPRRY